MLLVAVESPKADLGMVSSLKALAAIILGFVKTFTYNRQWSHSPNSFSISNLLIASFSSDFFSVVYFDLDIEVCR